MNDNFFVLRRRNWEGISRAAVNPCMDSSCKGWGGARAFSRGALWWLGCVRWADNGCNRVFGLFVGINPEKGEPWHIMKVAGAEPIVPKAFRPVGLSTSPRQRPIRLLMTDDCTACMGGW